MTLDRPNRPLLTLFAGADVYTPQHAGRRDIIVAGEKVVRLADEGSALRDATEDVETIDLRGLLLVPGFIDAHVHFLGGGGGDGYDSRSPELQVSDFTLNGVTTAVAPLGIDPVSRSLEGLLAKARALTEGGITAYVYTGGFRRPLVSLTGNPWRDAYLIPDIRGVKLALGVERAPLHSRRELIDLSRELYWAERATGKRLVLHVHLGPLMDGHELLREAAPELAVTERLVVTHLNRSEVHVETATDLARLGVWTDMTCMISPSRGMPGSVPAAEAVLRLRDSGAPLERVTLSTDGNGSVPERAAGGWQPYRTHMDSLLAELRALVAARMELDQVLRLSTGGPAEALGLDEKGRIEAGADADLIALAPGLEVREVFARGRRMVSGGRPVSLGRYERREL